jgi:hypothetical protein
MGAPEEEIQEGRKKRTYLLLAGGAASLLLPLAGVFYIKISESKAARAPGQAASVFDRREGGDAKVVITQTVTINPAVSAASSLPVPGGTTESPSGSSLDFVKGGSNSYFQDKAGEAPKGSTPTAAAAPPPEPEPEPKAATAKGGKKAFVMPRLSGTKSMAGSNFKSSGGSPKPGGMAGMAGVADPQSGKGGQDMADMLKNIPGGINNPDVQKLIQKNKAKK